MFKLPQGYVRKKILILGFGREGQSTYKFLRKYFASKKLVLSDQVAFDNWDPDVKKFLAKDKNLEIVSGKEYLLALSKANLVFKTPGIPNKLPQIKKAKKAGLIFTSQTKLFMQICDSTIVGVTGTKGKSTTSSLIAHILANCGIKNVLMGNIGKPPLDYLEDINKIVYVFEMSSHQLSDIDISPQIAVFLNIFPEHLDYYEDFDDYLNAKANITRFQSKKDVFIYNGKFPGIRSISKKTMAKRLDFNDFVLPSIKTDLKGQHNINNIKAAYLVAKELGLGEKDIIKAISSFKQLADRLEIVEIVNGVTYINDGLATIPQATIAALSSLKEKEITLILGGFDRGIDFSELAKALSLNKNVKSVILTGQVANKIEKDLINNQFKATIFNLGNANMETVIKLCAKMTRKGGVVLLSPAATSFDMYKDYKDRSDHFKKAVFNLKAKIRSYV